MPFKDPMKKKEWQKQYDANRLHQQSAKGDQWQINNRERNNETIKRRIERVGHKQGGIYAEMIDQQRNPLLISSENIAITCDWHIPFQSYDMQDLLIQRCRETDTKHLVIAGDYLDCDNFSKFIKISNTVTPDDEIEDAKKTWKVLLRYFETISLCRGNHEKRWIDILGGKLGMKELIKQTIPGNISEDDFFNRVKVTEDDHIHLIHNGQLWLLCHPKNFRQVNLSVVRDLCAKHQCNVIGAHGHQFCQGWDRSGTFRIADGGGMFHRESLDYLRETTCHPMTRNGFYILKNGEMLSFEPGPVKNPILIGVKA